MKPPLATAITALLGVVVPATLVLPAFAADPSSYRPNGSSVSTQTVAERELTRREEQVERGKMEIREGNYAVKDRDFEKAFAHYQAACDIIPNSLNSARLYREALRYFCDAGVSLAEQRITEGRYEDAGKVLKTVLQDQYDPHFKRALAVLAHLETPGYYNRTITPKYRANVEQVKQWFVDAQGFFDTARWDLAYKRCEQILGLDPYNIAARKMEESINRKKDDYAVEGYNNTRAHQVYEVDKAWDLPVRRFNVAATGPIVQEVTSTGRSQAIIHKLATIMVPKIEFREATIREAIDFLKKKSVELDPEKQGVNIVLRLDEGAGGALPAPAAAPVASAAPVIPGLEAVPGVAAPGTVPAVAASAPVGNPGDAHITVSLTNIPLGEALRYVTNLANLKYKVEEYAVSVVPLSAVTDALFTKEWKVPPSMFASTPGVGAGNPLDAPAASANGGGAAATGDRTKGTSGLATRVDAKDSLTAAGVVFPQGSSAVYLAMNSKLIVKNTQENLDLIDAIVQAQLLSGPVQVEIESKFVEIQQNNLKELSFDTLLGQANVPGTNKVFFGGGTNGTANGVDQSQFPFPVGSGTTQTFPTSTGLRTGTQAISQNAIDALLAGTSGLSAPSPATAAIGGIFSDPTFQIIIHAIDQKKGIDLLSAPRVTTKSGQRAVVEVIREFRYPTEFQPPQIPQTFGNTGGNTGVTLLPNGTVNPLATQDQGSFPVTPTTPTAFETRNTGVTLEVEPVIGPDNYTIDLNLVPQVVEFEGFVNYGSPIQTTSTNGLGQTQTNIITPNVINQPIFSTRKVTTSVSVFDGQTVVLGGLMSEDVQKVEDKIPLLGDLPLFGRLFRSNSEQHLKTNLVIFVTARLINPSGEAVHSEEEAEEVVENLALPEINEPALPLMPK